MFLFVNSCIICFFLLSKLYFLPYIYIFFFFFTFIIMLCLINRQGYLFQTYSNLISAACTSSIHCVRTTHDPGYVVWFIRPVIIRVKGNYPCATTAAIFDPQNPCNCGGVFTLSIYAAQVYFYTPHSCYDTYIFYNYNVTVIE